MPKTPLIEFAFMAIVSFSNSFGQNASSASLADAFEEYPKACITIYDLKQDRWIRHNSDRCKKRFIPASTFKVANSLIALETGVLDGPNHVLKWDGKTRSIKSWNKDHDLKSAVSNSAVWYFEEVARRVPPRKMSALLKAFDYGNHKISGGKPFWLSGDLAISPDEQVGFLRKLHADKLPLQKTVMTTVKELIKLDKTNDWTLFAKTGWAQSKGLNIGWFVGWLDSGDNTYFFATNIQSKSAKGFGQARKTITMNVLREIGAIPAHEKKKPTE